MNETMQPQRISENIMQDANGTYHWIYEMDLLKNPTIIMILWKIFFWIFVGIWAFVLVIDLFDGRLTWDNFVGWTTVAIYIELGMAVFIFFSYLIYLLFTGRKYCVRFEMNENGVTHIQLPKQVKKANAISSLLIFTGLASGNIGNVGKGMLIRSRTGMHSDFKSVRSIEIYPKRNVIKVNSPLNYNQVYAADEDFVFVESFIRAHVGKKCKVRS